MRKVAIAGLVLLLVAACTADPGHSTRLQVEFSGLGPDTEGRAVITGPEGTRTFARAETWTVRPGTYQVVVGQVREDDATLKAPVDRFEVLVAEGATSEVRVEYRVKIPDATKIAPAEDSPILSTTPTEVVLRNSQYAQDLQVGQIIATGATDRVAGAFAARVVSVDPRAEATVVQVEEVPLYIALPRMVIQVLQQPEPRAHQTGTDIFPGPPTIEGEAWSEVDLPGSCSRSGPKLTYDLKPLNATFKFTELDFEWDWGRARAQLWPLKVDIDLPGPKLTTRFETSLTGEASLGLKTLGEFSCEDHLDRTVLSGKACKYAKEFTLGALDAECKVAHRFQLSGGAAAGFEFGATAKLHAELKGHYSLEDNEPFVGGASNTPVEISGLRGQIESLRGVVRPAVESSAHYRVGLYKRVSVGMGSGKTRLELGFSEFINFGAKMTVHHLNHEAKVEFLIGDEMGLSIDVFGDKWDREPRFVPSWFKVPLASWQFGDENTKMRGLLPAGVRLPHDGEGSVEKGIRAWDVPPDGCRGNTPVPEDEARLDMRTAKFSQPGGHSETWQLAVYRDDKTAAAAIAGMKTRTGCTGQWTPQPIELSIGDGGFAVNSFEGPRNIGEIGAGKHWTVVRKGNALLLLYSSNEHESRPDLRVAHPQSVEAATTALKDACKTGLRC